MQRVDTLVNILESFLGESKNGASDTSQIQFNCPACDCDGDHYNLEINILKGKYRCWSCEHINGMSGKLSSLIKNYGGDSLLKEYRNEISNIKKSKEYELNFIENEIMFEDDEEFIIKLPEKSYDFKFDGNKKEEVPLNYLKNRNLDEYFIKKFNLKYTSGFCKEKNYSNRIIIPSYDKFGNLNYFTGRDYTGKSSRKYFNAMNAKRKDIIFNECFINWDSDIILVEGPTDHLVMPNSIPLLGKDINPDFYLFECIQKLSTQNIIVFLDNDAIKDSVELCKKLSSYQLCGRLRYIPTEELRTKINHSKKINLVKLDPSKLYELYGKKGISWALKQSEEYFC